MESARFDRFARLLGAATTRRAGLGLAVAALTGAAIAEPADAAFRCRRGRQTCQRNSQCCSGTCRTGRDVPLRDRNRCTCEGGLTLCNNACVDTDIDMRHCGACGNTCKAGDHCIDGACRIHQQCYSDDNGMCVMTPFGKEYRVDGVYIPEEIQDADWTPCKLDSECTNAYAVCDAPGVSCACVRAFDTGQGYDDVTDSGSGICAPLLDNGDEGVTCQATGSDDCFFTADGDELLGCTGNYIDVGDCIDYSCNGVGPCDDEGVGCTCIIAAKSGPFRFYVNFFFPPTCIAWSTESGICPT